MTQVLEQALGAVLSLVVMLDIFLLVLYARANTGLISKYLSNYAWRAAVWLARPLGRWRSACLSLAGPVILVLVLVTWALLLALGAALIVHPQLGRGVRATTGPTPTDFATALYAGGTSLSFITAGDFIPQTAFFRLYYLFNSLIGVSAMTLTITYLLELYTSLQARNAAGLKVHLLSAETGDAAEIIAGLGPQGRFEAGYTQLAEWAAEIAQVKEAHHFYPALFYFRFHDSFYSLSRAGLIALDTVSLIRSALADDAYAWLKQSAAVEQLWRGTLMELRVLAANVRPEAQPAPPPDEATRAAWQRRYAAAVERLQRAGISTAAAGAGDYVALRTQWDGLVTRLAASFAFNLDEVDTALARVKQA
jgi:hypothetical protein